jgi:hypothetical protein
MKWKKKRKIISSFELWIKSEILFNRKLFVPTKSPCKFVNRILPLILVSPVGKLASDTQYKSVHMSLKYQGKTVERHAFINNVEIYKINIIIQFMGTCNFWRRKYKVAVGSTVKITTKDQSTCAAVEAVHKSALDFILFFVSLIEEGRTLTRALNIQPINN